MALSELCRRDDPLEHLSTGELLIIALFEEFQARPETNHLGSDFLANLLVNKVASRWYGRPSTGFPRVMSDALRPFGIKPDQKKQPDGKNLRGYSRSDIEDAYSRYGPSLPPEATAQELGEDEKTSSAKADGAETGSFSVACPALLPDQQTIPAVDAVMIDTGGSGGSVNALSSGGSGSSGSSEETADCEPSYLDLLAGTHRTIVEGRTVQ